MCISSMEMVMGKCAKACPRLTYRVLSATIRRMFYSDRLMRATKFAIKTHEIYQKQKRKGKDVPYIVHPLIVGLILARAGASEETVAAGILHDTIEDSIESKKVTRNMLVERFGEKVAKLVESVTEEDQRRPWDERKREALDAIATFSHNSVLVKSADTLANVTELIDDYEREGDAIWKRFAGGREKTLHNYKNVIDALLKRWPLSPLSRDLRLLRKNVNNL